jgi:predicted nucleotidyltransferase
MFEQVSAELRPMLPELRRQHPIADLGVFGSYVRGEQRADSDLDVLVEFDGPIDLFSYVRLQDEIGDRIGVPVDLVHRKGLKPLIRAEILREVEAV